jgi:hypothetical protein
MLGNIKLLQQEPKRTNLQLRDFIIAPVDGESQIGVEGLESSGSLAGTNAFMSRRELGSIDFSGMKMVVSSVSILRGSACGTCV